MSRPISRGVSIKRFNTHPTLRFSFFFYFLFFFWKGERWITTTTWPHVLDIERVGIGKCTFRSHFHPRLYLFTQRRVSFGHLPTRFQILIVSERMSSDVDPPRWLRRLRECDDTANSERIFRYTPGCIKFCNVINACLTSRILAIRRIDKCLKFLFFSLYISFYIKSGHRVFLIRRNNSISSNLLLLKFVR